jgi:ABC-type transport system involved in multi-copper enzyme maturation permease subunit
MTRSQLLRLRQLDDKCLEAQDEKMIASDLRSAQTLTQADAPLRSRNRKIAVIALNTFRESVRDRVLYNLILCVLILVGASIFISELSVHQETKFIATLGLSLLLVVGALIAVFIGVALVYKEIDRRTIYNLLTKPVHRYQFILGKYAGLCLTLLVNSLMMLLATEAALMYVNRGVVPLQVSVLAAGYLIFLELALLVAIALMFSSFSTPLLATLFSFALYVIGQFSADLKLAAALSESALVRALLTGLYYLIPNLANFSFITEASHGQIVPMQKAVSATLYAAVYIAILLSASVLIFQRRNFK